MRGSLAALRAGRARSPKGLRWRICAPSLRGVASAAVGARSDLDAWWRAGTALLLPIFHSAFRLRVEGIANVPAEGAAILASNHVSSLDGVVLAVVTAGRRKRRTRFLIAAEYFDNPVTRTILNLARQIPVHRGAHDTDALAEAERAIREGTLAGIYPEGGVAEDPSQGVRRGKSGMARVALATGAMVVPIGIWGTQVRWPYPGLAWRGPWRPRLALTYGTPIRPEEPTGDPGSAQRFTERVMAAIAVQTERARQLTEEVR